MRGWGVCRGVLVGAVIAGERQAVRGRVRMRHPGQPRAGTSPRLPLPLMPPLPAAACRCLPLPAAAACRAA